MFKIQTLRNEIDKSYIKELSRYNPPNTSIKAKNMLAIMMARKALKKGKIWWYAWELIGIHDEFFGSHKTPARFSDLVRYYPELFTSKPVGRFMVYRLKFEDMTQSQLEEMTKVDYELW